MVKDSQFDVEPKHLTLVKKILKRHIAYKTVWTYGSRVNWTANQYSDLDLVVFEVSAVKLGELKEDFAESDLPFSVDIILWEKIPENFKNKIRGKYVVLQEKPKLDNWKECKLGDVADSIISGGTPLTKRTEFYNGSIPWLNTKEIKNCRIHKTEKYITEEGLDGSSAKWIDKNSVIVAMYGATAGKVAINKIPLTTNQACCNITVDYEKSDYNYLFYLLLNSFDELDQMTSGAAQQNLNVGLISSFEILLPPLPEQKVIASVLSSLDDKTDLLHRQNKTLEAMAETLFRQWFVEEAKEDWVDKCLGNIADINPTYQLKKGEVSTYVEMKNVSTSTFNPKGWYKREFTSGMKFKNGDTLLARITPCLENGKTCFVTFLDEEETGWGSTEYIVIRMKEPFHPYISYIIAKDKDFRDFAISSMSGSSGRQRAQADVINEYDIKVPPLEIIEKLNCLLAGILSKLKNNANQIRTLEKLRETLLPKLMGGEVRVEYGN